MRLLIFFREEKNKDWYNGKIKDLKQAIKNWESRRASQQHRIAAGIEEERRAIIRKSEWEQKADRQRVVGQRPLNVADVFRGRLSEREELGRMLADKSTRVVSIIGRTGIGKTALASKILADLVRGQFEKAEDYADKALSLYRESKWENELVYVMNVQGNGSDRHESAR